MQAEITLTKEECEAVHEMISMLSGCNPENVFAWDGTDSNEDTTTRAFAKIYKMAGANVPDSCK